MAGDKSNNGQAHSGDVLNVPVGRFPYQVGRVLGDRHDRDQRPRLHGLRSKNPAENEQWNRLLTAAL